MDKDDSGTLTKEEILARRQDRGRGPEVPDFLRQPEPVGPDGAQQARKDARRARHGQEWRGGPARVVRFGVSKLYAATRLTGPFRTQEAAIAQALREQARAAGQGPRRGRGEGARRERGLHQRIPEQGARGVRAHRQGRLRFARDRRDYAGRQVGRGRQGLPQDVRRRDAHVPAAAEAARPRAARARHGRLGRGRHRRVYGPASDLS